MEILTSWPEDFAAYQKSEQERWFKVIKENDSRGDCPGSHCKSACVPRSRR
jgi:hypothetical protein